MMTIRIFIALSLFGLLAACGGPGENAVVPKAQPAVASFVDIGDYVVHFSAQSTSELPLAVATEYDYARSKNLAMLTVSIIRESDGQSSPGEVSVKTRNLAGQPKNVTMEYREARGDSLAIYYIGITSIVNRETLIFDISVKPEGVDYVSNVRFQRQFFTD